MSYSDKNVFLENDIKYNLYISEDSLVDNKKLKCLEQMKNEVEELLE